MKRIFWLLSLLMTFGPNGWTLYLDDVRFLSTPELVRSSVIDPDNGWGYFGLNTNRGFIQRVRLADFEFQGSLALNEDEGHLTAAAIDRVHGYAYFTCQAGKIVKIRLSDFSRVDALTLQPNEGVLSAAIDSKGEYAYFGTSELPAKVIKVRLSDFTRVADLPMGIDEDILLRAVIDPRDEYAYFLSGASNGRLVKIRLSDFSRVGSIAMGIICRSMTMTHGGDALYIGCSLNQVIKINLSTFSEEKRLILNLNFINAYSSFITPDDAFLYLATTRGVGPASLVRISLPDFTLVRSLTLPTYSNTVTSSILEPAGNWAFLGASQIPNLNPPTMSQILRINLSDEKGFKFSAPAYEVTEQPFSTQLVVSVERTGDPDGIVSVDLNTQEGSAREGTDYSPVVAILSWGSGNTTPKLITIPIMGDVIPEFDEQFSLHLSRPVGGATILDPNPVNVIIKDLLVPTRGQIKVEFPATNITREGDGPIVFNFLREGGLTGPLSLQYDTANGTAQSGFDFTQQSGIVRFADNDNAPQSISVPIVDDFDLESDESFSVVFHWLDGELVGQTESFLVTIKDNEVAPPLAFDLLPSKNLIDLSKGEVAELQVRFDAPTHLEITIYDRLGRRICDLINTEHPSGANRIEWPGRDSDGDLVAAGVYTALIREGGKTRKIPIIVLK